MNPTKKLIGAAVLTAGLAGGGVAGALLFTPGVSGAQTETTADTDPGTAADTERAHPLQTAAEALGMTVDELRTELEADKSIATIAEERGVDVDTVIDALVEDARARITEAVNEEGGVFGRGGPGHHGRWGFGIRGGLDDAADVLGITNEELVTALRDGQTIAEVAAAQGVDVQAVIDAIVAEVGEEHRDQVTTFVNEGGPRFGGPRADENED